jgi:hypothetical protein
MKGARGIARMPTAVLLATTILAWLPSCGGDGARRAADIDAIEREVEAFLASGEGLVEVGSLSAIVDGEPTTWAVLSWEAELLREMQAVQGVVRTADSESSSATWTDWGGAEAEAVIQGYSGGRLDGPQLQVSFFFNKGEGGARVEVREGEGRAAVNLLDPPAIHYQLWEGTVEATRIELREDGPGIVEGVFEGALVRFQGGRNHPDDSIQIREGRFRTDRLLREK